MTAVAPLPLVQQFEYGLDAPICLTWELTYACNLSCVHCLSSSGRRDPRELSTAECKAVIDELERMLAHLPARVATALVLHRVAGYSVQEVGEELGVSRETAKKYLARAVEHCRNLRATERNTRL